MTKLRKLTQDEYYEIQEQYDRTPEPDCQYILSTGEHWLLKDILDRMGFRTPGTREAYDLAGDLLSREYVHDEQGSRFSYH